MGVGGRNYTLTMGRIKGHYEWDDDDLTPGKKKEGGLHQNLFDSDGNLKGSARFVPSNEDESDARADSEPVFIYVTDEADLRRRQREQEQRDEFVAQVLTWLIEVGIPKGVPLVKRVWKEKARPAIKAQWGRVARRGRRARALPVDSPPIVVEATVVEPSEELATDSEQFNTNMSSSEAQARLLAAHVARAFSDEQVNLVAAANILDDEGFSHLQRALSRLPPEQVALMLENLEANPSMLTGDALAGLGMILGIERADEGYLSLEERRER